MSTVKGRQLLLLSSSNCHGFTLLEFARTYLDDFLKTNNVTEILFVPYAQVDHDTYTATIGNVFHHWGYRVSGIHTHQSPQDAVKSAKAIFVGGGNTFLLLKQLYDNNLVELIRDRVFKEGLLYIGSSAGSNVATKSINTTNDMPITYPPSFDGIALVPFNINPHYLEVLDPTTHKGETRDQRIEEYLQQPHCAPVLGLKEGAILHVEGESAFLKGIAGATLFIPKREKKNYSVGADLSFLLKEDQKS